MIINTEVKDFTRNGVPVLDSYGRCKRILVVSYVDKEGKVQLFGYPIPEEMMYQWKYAKKNETPDSMFQSWDFKPVIKEPILGNFSEQRIHEILIDLQRLYPNDPQIPQFYELNIPETTFADIETDVDELGYSKPLMSEQISIRALSLLEMRHVLSDLHICLMRISNGYRMKSINTLNRLMLNIILHIGIMRMRLLCLMISLSILLDQPNVSLDGTGSDMTGHIW